MSDNLKDRGEPDRSRINVHEQHEVVYWTKALGVDEARLKQLVATHGMIAADVRKALGK